MTTFTPTKSSGATAVANEVLYVDPSAEITADALAAQIQLDGLNTVFVADLLSGMLTHERCGAHLYRAVSTRAHNPMLKRRYEQFGQETVTHVEILERLIEQCGGNPNYISATTGRRRHEQQAGRVDLHADGITRSHDPGDGDARRGLRQSHSTMPTGTRCRS